MGIEYVRSSMAVLKLTILVANPVRIIFTKYQSLSVKRNSCTTRAIVAKTIASIYNY